MPIAVFKIDKKLYSLSCLQACSLAFPECGIKIEDTPDFYLATCYTSSESISESSFFRTLNEFALRESLENKFHSEREAIYRLVFEQE